MLTSLVPSPSRRSAPRAHVSAEDVQKFVEEVVSEDMHALRVLSLTNGVLGVLHCAALGIHAIGRALAAARGLDVKHAVKQIDRLLSNRGVDVWQWFSQWVPFVVAARDKIVVALDWTHFEPDDQATIAIYLITSHGRATPLMWKTHRLSSLKDHRWEYETDLIDRLHEILRREIDVTVLADRGFGDQELYAYLGALGWSYVIRFRECIHVTDASGECKPASEWVPPSGHAKMLREVCITQKKTPLGAVVVKQQKGMKEAWCLATNRVDLNATGVVDLYAKRFTIEETFRDLKDPRFGTGLSNVHISRPDRRDRLMLLFSVAHALLTLLGAAGEEAGLDRTLKANTSPKRALSLFNQGCFWFSAIPNMREERLRPLMQAFANAIANHAALSQIFGVI
jgi:Transposase DDE domain